MISIRPWFLFGLWTAIFLVVAGCTNRQYRKSADREAARILTEKSRLVKGMESRFSIETNAPVDLGTLPVFQPTPEDLEFLGTEGEEEKGARIISLARVLEIATKQSRSYQSRKEVLYLQALSLSLARHRFTPIFSAGGGAAYHNDPIAIQNGVNTIIEREENVSMNGRAGVDMAFRTGARLITSFSTDFLRFLTGNPRPGASSSLASTLTQPLLRGAGFKIATESLTQAERDLLYALRDFTRYRKEFSVTTADTYFSILQTRDSVRNNWRGYQNFRLNVAREEAFAREGLRAQASLDELKQAELSTQTRWINSVRSYRQRLDQFKLDLGLPLDTNIILDDAELAQLKIEHPNLAVNDAVQVALESRLDLQNQRDALADSRRHVNVAADSLLPGVDLVAGVNVPGRGGNNPNPDFKNYSWYTGLDVDLPIDRKAQRNAYRGALISQARTQREFDLAVDQVRLQIVDGWRNLDQARRNYDIAELGVQISERRVEEQTIRSELGRGTARELVDAQNAMIASKNERTSALVAHTMARLRFWRDMGILTVGENGKWEEMKDGEVKAHP